MTIRTNEFNAYFTGATMRPRGRLTASDIPLIRALLDSGMPVAEAARKFEVRKQNIYSIKNNKS
ncbi:hypothetical protein SGGMMB4_00221 [Sodalis glossinidius str. 'morsitans']|uniref:Resolvase HTH domain-containing protein n=1 Tax=Sodalis glossinidius (strain morsitans) TaxID=343509 RepID=A0A193QFL0_SODGM|nr:hypothetical protein SGGMMB4_00221 [Sodalis glossinidius str. 'morsitans']